jgi:hypothetical protein
MMGRIRKWSVGSFVEFGRNDYAKSCVVQALDQWCGGLADGDRSVGSAGKT